MKPQLTCARLVVKKSPISGYGVFADQTIPAGDTIEESYAIPVFNQEPELANYYFGLEGDERLHMLSLGYGSIYNHSDNPNAEFFLDKENGTIIFCAKRNIKPGDEILIHYGANWFSSRFVKPKKPTLFFRLRKSFLIRIVLRTAVVLGLIYILTYLLNKLVFPLQLF